MEFLIQGAALTADAPATDTAIRIVLYDSISYDSYNPDTFQYTRGGLKDGFRKAGCQREIEVLRFGSATDPAFGYLTLHFYEYSPKRVRLAAFYLRGEQRIKVGYFTQNLEIDHNVDLPPPMAH